MEGGGRRVMVPRHGIAVHSAEYVGTDAAAKKNFSVAAVLGSSKKDLQGCRGRMSSGWQY